MKLEVGNHCPLLNKSCIQTQCAWFTQIRGTNPQSKQAVDEWGCAVAWLPVLLLENTQEARQTGAAVESQRNETVQGLFHLGQTISAAARERTKLLAAG